MKKYVLLFVLFFAVVHSYGQELKNIKIYILSGQYDKAKPEIDAYMANEKNAAKAEGWYYKAAIYTALGVMESTPADQKKTYLQASFNALKKYRELDPKFALTTEEANKTIFNTYYGYDDLGIKAYTAKNYTESFTSFQKALEVHDYIAANGIAGANGYKFSALDTSMVWNLAIIANELKNKDDALVYFRKIADANLSDEKYATAYDELVIKAMKEKNAADFAKYIAAAKQHYPVDNQYWEMREIEFSIGELEGEALLNKYEELTKSLPNNYVVFYNYAVEIDKFLTGDAAKNKDANAVALYRARMEELYKKALSIKSTIETNLQLANIYYNKTFDMQERIAKIKGTKPAELKVKNDLIAESKALSLASIPYAETAADLLSKLEKYKFSDKANYKLALEILSHGYKVKGDAAKVAETEKRKLEVEKL
ncbi:MAG: hypothetical protein JNM14_07930 [Ferruginibacter sp.]|nr:hypothetical protein [Ferruginibacter sp.]